MVRYVKFINENTIEEAPVNRPDLGICNYNCDVELMMQDGYLPLDETEQSVENKNIPYYVLGKEKIIRKFKAPLIKEKTEDQLACEIRLQRNQMLSVTDWTMCRDVHLSENVEAAYVKYRQELRDITEQEGFPYNVVYPILDLKGTENE